MTVPAPEWDSVFPFVTFNGTWTTLLANIGEASNSTGSTANTELRCCRSRQRQVVSYRNGLKIVLF